jgi:glucoamylase
LSSRSRAFSSRSFPVNSTSCRFASSAAANASRSDRSAPASASTEADPVTEHSKYDHAPQITHPGPGRVTTSAGAPSPAHHRTSDYVRLNKPAGLGQALSGLRNALGTHWSSNDGWYVSIPRGVPKVPDFDPNADVVMACVYGSIPCTYPKLLSTAAKLREAFDVGGKHEYPINCDDHKLRDIGPMVGRYPGDTYDGDMQEQSNEGHPWAICTANFAQLYYLVAKEFQNGTGPAWDGLTAAFFTQVGLDEATVNAGGQAVADALIAAADKMLRAIMFHSAEGHISEQFDKVTGYEKSVEDLTWSYAAFMSAVRARP